jgi:hypothetical protein
MQRWYDLGKFKSQSFEQFKSSANSILRKESLQGSLAKLYLQEPTPGSWGNTKKDLPRHAGESLMMQLQAQTAFRMTEKGFEEQQLGGHPEIQVALEKDKVKMLVAMMPNGTRTVAILIIN